MILMGNSRFPRHNMNVLFMKVILSYIQGAPMNLYLKINTHIKLLICIVVGVIASIVKFICPEHAL